MLRPVGLASVLAAALLVAPTRARADERVETIQRVLDDGEPAAMRWWALWSAGFGAALVGNGVASFAFAPGPERDSARVQTVTSGIALVTTLAIPMPARSAGTRLRAFEGEPSARAREAERLLAESAEAEAFGASWLAHAGALVVNGAAGAWLGWHDGHPWYGLLAFATGELVAEAKILTMPRGALRGRARLTDVAWSVACAPIAGGGWIGVGGSF